MKRYKVSYTEHSLREIEVDAETPEEAEDLVRSGNTDYDLSIECDAELCDVTNVQEIDRPIIDADQDQRDQLTTRLSLRREK